ncbi:hypothetical protein CY34DRAFT_803090 [Suillus luteus UH-Slu-Lm8-n1]|uniref:Uncharacterized protein n=1 Tax=Suillus luteus UH-Slu-Lm8-n1 TaxID=930992 RepID=A0A0D0A2B3_9AGAM|nr:hypothetical protein CY34DRAFT_803090 [Suillus luteus UH-Slu-Lm8-n1]
MQQLCAWANNLHKPRYAQRAYSIILISRCMSGAYTPAAASSGRRLQQWNRDCLRLWANALPVVPLLPLHFHVARSSSTRGSVQEALAAEH